MVMDELREATLQYTNHPDPIESAARRQRVLDGEVHGLMEKTAASIIAAAYELHQQQSLRNAVLQVTILCRHVSGCSSIHKPRSRATSQRHSPPCIFVSACNEA